MGALRVKLFWSNVPSKLEHMINAFLEKNNYEIVNLKITSTIDKTDAYDTVMIMYKVNPNDNIKTPPTGSV